MKQECREFHIVQILIMVVIVVFFCGCGSRHSKGKCVVSDASRTVLKQIVKDWPTEDQELTNMISREFEVAGRQYQGVCRETVQYECDIDHSGTLRQFFAKAHTAHEEDSDVLKPESINQLVRLLATDDVKLTAKSTPFGLQVWERKEGGVRFDGQFIKVSVVESTGKIAFLENTIDPKQKLTLDMSRRIPESRAQQIAKDNMKVPKIPSWAEMDDPALYQPEMRTNSVELVRYVIDAEILRLVQSRNYRNGQEVVAYSIPFDFRFTGIGRHTLLPSVNVHIDTLNGNLLWIR